MSEATNTALIQRMYDAFGRGDIQTILGSVAPDAEWIDYGPPAVPYFGDFSGRITDFFRAIGESTTGGSVAIDQYIASGEMVVAAGWYRATARDTGAKIDAALIHIFQIRGDKVVSWKGYGDTAAVLEAHRGKTATA